METIIASVLAVVGGFIVLHSNPSAAHIHDKNLQIFVKYKAGDRVGKTVITGKGIAPLADEYKIKLSLDETPDRVFIVSCDKRVKTEFDEGGYFHFKKEDFKVVGCPVHVFAFVTGGLKEAVVYFDNKNNFKSLAKIECKGDIKVYKGVSFCHDMANSEQKIYFKDAVLYENTCNAEVSKSKSGKALKIKLKKGLCIFDFIDINKESHRTYFFGESDANT